MAANIRLTIDDIDRNKVSNTLLAHNLSNHVLDGLICIVTNNVTHSEQKTERSHSQSTYDFSYKLPKIETLGFGLISIYKGSSRRTENRGSKRRGRKSNREGERRQRVERSNRTKPKPEKKKNIRQRRKMIFALKHVCVREKRDRERDGEKTMDEERRTTIGSVSKKKYATKEEPNTIVRGSRKISIRNAIVILRFVRCIFWVPFLAYRCILFG